MTVADEIAQSEYNQKLVPWFLETYRGMQDVAARERLANELIKRGCFYVPFEKYFYKFFGSRAVNAFNEYYSRGKCVLAGSMVIPLNTVTGELLGYLRNNPKAQDKYNYPEKYLFDKANFLQTTTSNLNKAFERGYICIVEGVYDEMSVASLDIPCVGLSGSELGKVRRIILDVIPTKIVISDKDSAGSKLFKECDKNFHGKVINFNLATGDIDNYLRTESNAIKFIQIISKNFDNGFPYSIIEVDS